MVNNSNSTSSYAIDFGTSNTAIARWNAVTQEGELVRLPSLSQQFASLPPLIPSLIYVKNAQKREIIAGQAVRDRGLDFANNPRFFRNFKRGIATDIQGFLPELDGQNLSFERVGEWFLRELIVNLQGETKENLESLVLTVPVDSFESYRNWLMGVCQSLAVEQIRILDEPTAAALGYGAVGGELLLVVDFGGGTIDLSLVQLSTTAVQTRGYILKWGQKMLGENSAQKKNIARVIAKAGANLGGADIDNWLVDYFARTQELPKSSLTTRLAERLKIKLSEEKEAREVYFNDETLETYELGLDRPTFERILEQQGFFDRLDDLMTQVLQQARRNGVENTEIDSILLVGGSVKIPAVQNWIKQYFDEALIKNQRHFEAIATGALQVSQSVEIEDFLYHSYGIRYWNRKIGRHDWHPIIKTGQPYPTNRPVELVLGASTPNQSSLELIIGELAAETGNTEVYFDGDRLITHAVDADNTQVQPLNDREGARTIAKLEPLGNPGSDRLKLLFNIDSQRYLRITVEDLLTQQTLLNNYIVVQLN
ncbi:Hsp70 family protein [Waterburya agarophytonicola K14]|uniref:Hsp70 family protein n=1 Tax=Waterburya agarophytonicola KI4 TaxID=2874699 RepID=A0A964FEZ3_9CYAN|nr:Hsp70 family protein [Waterburya agarophytonicola]MCC0176442.1 Hsp70 family protein [Waterburya agarophytonicola KI4]